MKTDSGSYDLGYIYYPCDRPHHPGHPRLDIFIHSRPSERHFDPEKVRLPVITAQKDLELVEIDHPWTGQKEARSAIGRIRMVDRRNKVVEAFTYGGSLQIDSNEERTFCTHQSPATILELTPVNPIAMLLAQETEILLAERRAAWAHALEQYEGRLAGADPVTLYAACLEAIIERYRQFPATEDDTIRRLRHFLREEIHFIHEVHNLPARKLSDLL